MFEPKSVIVIDRSSLVSTEIKSSEKMFGSYRRGRTHLRIGEDSAVFGVLKLFFAVALLITIPTLAYLNEKIFRMVSESVHEIAHNVTSFNPGSQAGDIVHLEGVNYTSTVEDPEFKVTMLL